MQHIDQKATNSSEDSNSNDEPKASEIVYQAKAKTKNTVSSIDPNKDDGYDEDEEEDDDEPKSTSNNDSSEYHEEEPVDPRIQIELERLNKSSSDVNRLENELDEAKALFISTRNRQSQRLEYLQKKLGSSIAKAKPYYDALINNERLHKETQKAVQEFQKAISHYKTAKETLSVAEESLSSRGISDVWQEYLSETITKISLSKKAADQAEEFHKQKAIEYQMAEKSLQYLEKDLKRSIEKSKYYYEEKDRWQKQLEAQKLSINELEKALSAAKSTYAEAMNTLRSISDEIHLSRRARKMKINEKRESTAQIYSNLVACESTSTLIASKSLNDIANTTDSNEDVTSESNSVDTMSISSDKRSAIDRRMQFAIVKQPQIEHYQSFSGAHSSAPSSRCQSPVNDADKTLLKDEGVVKPEKVKHFLQDLNDSGKYSYSIDSNKSPDVKTPSLINEEKRLPAPPSRKMSPKTTGEKPKKHLQETPLLANLMLYNNGLIRGTNAAAQSSHN